MWLGASEGRGRRDGGRSYWRERGIDYEWEKVGGGKRGGRRGEGVRSGKGLAAMSVSARNMVGLVEVDGWGEEWKSVLCVYGRGNGRVWRVLGGGWWW